MDAPPPDRPAPPTPDQWYLAPAGHAEGPVPLLELRARFRSGPLGGDVAVRHVRWNAWQPAHSVDWLRDLTHGTATAGTTTNEGVRASVGTAFRRASARLIDTVLLMFVAAIVSPFALGGVTLPDAPLDATESASAVEGTWPLLVFIAIVGIVGETLMLRLGRGRTPGKALFGLRVTARGGHVPTWSLALRRTIAAWGIGLGFALPLLNLLLPIVQFVRVLDAGRTHYDQLVGVDVDVQQLPAWRLATGGLLVALLVLLFIAAIGAVALGRAGFDGVVPAP